MQLRATEVFTPNDFPTYTYIERIGQDLEQSLRNALDTPNTVISLSGPSKSGKTVLVEKVVGKPNLLTVSGAELTTPDELWSRVLDVLGQPISSAEHAAVANASSGSAAIAAKGTVLVAEVSGTGTYQATQTATDTVVQSYGRSGLAQVEKEIAGSDFVIFIDDFHYMDRATQIEVAKAIRAASGRRIRICIASVPHRSDDLVRSNSELRGRTVHIDTKFWSEKELTEIATLGFAALNYEVDDAVKARFAQEACGSPQLMQQICLQACFKLEKTRAPEKLEKLPITINQRKAILEQAATHTDYSSLVNRMHEGAKTRGVERKVHQFKDGTSGDVYRGVLLAIANGEPIRMDLPYSILVERVAEQCIDVPPAGASITAACAQISGFAMAMYPDQRIIEWDTSEGAIETLSFVDPYLLFYLRSSSRLAELGR